MVAADKAFVLYYLALFSFAKDRKRWLPPISRKMFTNIIRTSGIDLLAKVVIGQNPFLRKLFRLPKEGSGKYSLFLQSSQQDGLTMYKGSVFYVWLVPEDNKLQCWRLRGLT